MLSKELQNLADKIGGVLLVEDGKPKFVLLSFKKFDELSGLGSNGLAFGHDNQTPTEETRSPIDVGFEHIGSGLSQKQSELENLYQEEKLENSVDTEDGELIERLNKEIMALKEEIEAKEKELGLLAEE